jgi:sugar/nucleoside kinase (ribokinase family)
VPDLDYELVFGEAYPLLDYLLVNNDDAMLLSGQPDVPSSILWFLERGVKTCAITTGGAGVIVQSLDGEPIVIPAFEVEVVDTTGCGDAFSAGFIAAVTRGKSLEEAALWGVGMGSFTAQALGSDASPKSFTELQRFISTTPRYKTS